MHVKTLFNTEIRRKTKKKQTPSLVKKTIQMLFSGFKRRSIYLDCKTGKATEQMCSPGLLGFTKALLQPAVLL